MTQETENIVGTTTWTIDPAHSKISFSARHMVITEVTGQFDKFDLKMTTEGEEFTNSNIEFTIDAQSVNTGIQDRDNHLRSADFFEAEKYPELKFVSKTIKKTDDEEYKMTGDMTIRDITKEIELDVTYGGQIVDPWGNTRAGFSIKGKLNRFDFGLRWNSLIEAGGAVVSKNINILCTVEVIKQQS